LAKAENGKIKDLEAMPYNLERILSLGEDRSRPIAFSHGDHTDLDHSRNSKIIPTGIKQLDYDLGGGLAVNELGVVIAGLKVGKTTSGCIKAVNAADLGHVVLHVYFEDTKEQVRMKYRAKMTKTDLFQFRKKENRRKIEQKSDAFLEKVYNGGGMIIQLRLKADEEGVKDIIKAIDEIEKVGIEYNGVQGFVTRKVDLVIVDYVDCFKPKNNYKQAFEGDKEVIRDLERMVREKDVACWAYTQGNRSSLDSELVVASNTGGGISKLQVAHVLISYAKTLAQRGEGLATIAILGSRVGRDGIAYKNVVFDNAKLIIDIPLESIEQMTSPKDAGSYGQVYDEDNDVVVSPTTRKQTVVQEEYDDDEVPF
jgi:hypothetical protein